jgi:hypothetical protein
LLPNTAYGVAQLNCATRYLSIRISRTGDGIPPNNRRSLG